MSLNALLRERPSDFADEGYARKDVANTQPAVQNFQGNGFVTFVRKRIKNTRGGFRYYDGAQFGFPLEASLPPIDDGASVDGDNWERALVELGSLEADDDFIPPKKSALADLEEIAEILRGPLPLRIRFPTIEHDSSTGIVSLAWFDTRTLSTFSISLLGGRKLFSIFVDPTRNFTRDFPRQTLDSRDLEKMWEVPEIATTVVDIRVEA